MNVKTKLKNIAREPAQCLPHSTSSTKKDNRVTRSSLVTWWLGFRAVIDVACIQSLVWEPRGVDKRRNKVV